MNAHTHLLISFTQCCYGDLCTQSFLSNGFYNIYEHVVAMMFEARQTFVLCTFRSPAEVVLMDAVCVFLQNFLNSSSCPEIQGYLHLKEPGRKSWKKLYMFLRRSGLYYSTKGTSKVINYGHIDSETGMEKNKCVGDSFPYLVTHFMIAKLCVKNILLLNLFLCSFSSFIYLILICIPPN